MNKEKGLPKAQVCSYSFYAKSFKKNEKDKKKIQKKYLNQIICGDSEEILKKIPSRSIDLIFTSPPYNFGMKQADFGKKALWKNYFGKLKKIFRQCIRVLKYGGRLVVNIQPLFSDYIPSHHIISNIIMKLGMIHRNEIVWDKNNYNAKYTAWGSWNSPSCPYLKYTWEFVEVFSKGSIKKEGERKNIDLTAKEFKEWVVGWWNIAPERKMKEFNHDAMFPEELAKRVIKLFSFKNDVVLDPFNGAGTTTKMAKELGRKYIGIDISQEYCQKATKRTN
jgi:DNA modification methylase